MGFFGLTKLRIFMIIFDKKVNIKNSFVQLCISMYKKISGIVLDHTEICS